MKFAGTRVGDGRGQMRERHRRDRAATQLMRERYPAISVLQLEFKFSDGGEFSPAPQVIVLHPPARAFLVFPCPYTDCDGDFNLASAVEQLASSGEARQQGQLRCAGHRSRGRGSDGECGLVLDFQLVAHRG